MDSWPSLGTRVTVRYRRPAGSVPPLTDAVGRLLSVDPTVRVQTKRGSVVECKPADVVALRVLTDAPVRTAEIRALEHAAAAAWPGVEHRWLDGWLLRAGHGATLAANSAVPLDISANASAIPAIVEWYTQRNLTPLLAIPDRLLTPPVSLAITLTEQVWARDASSVTLALPPDPSVTLEQRPGENWVQRHGQEEPVDVLTAVIDGELVFGTTAGAAARAAVTGAPDGTRWVGLSQISGADDQQRQLCEALVAWGASRGATRGYLCVPDTGTAALAESMGFRPQHHRRYHPVAHLRQEKTLA